MHTEISFPNLGIYLKNVGKSIDLFGIEIAYYGNGQVRIRKIILIWGLSASLRELSGQDFIM